MHAVRSALTPRGSAAKVIADHQHHQRKREERHQRQPSEKSQTHEQRHAAKQAAEQERERCLAAQADAEQTEANRDEQAEEWQADKYREVGRGVIGVEFRELFRRQHLLFLYDVGKAHHSVANATRVVAVPEARREVVADDLSGEAIGQHPFEAVTDFDRHVPIVDGNQHEDAVIRLRLPDAPLLEQAVGVSRARHAAERRDRRDGNFGGGRLFEQVETAIDLGLDGRIDHIGKIVDAAGRAGERLREGVRR